jgi:hypothetical protein
MSMKVCNPDDLGQVFLYNGTRIYANGTCSFSVFLHLFLLYAEFAISPNTMCHGSYIYLWGYFGDR